MHRACGWLRASLGTIADSCQFGSITVPYLFHDIFRYAMTSRHGGLLLANDRVLQCATFFFISGPTPT